MLFNKKKSVPAHRNCILRTTSYEKGIFPVLDVMILGNSAYLHCRCDLCFIKLFILRMLDNLNNVIERQAVLSHHVTLIFAASITGVVPLPGRDVPFLNIDAFHLILSS